MKSLTVENLLAPDPTILIFQKLNLRTGEVSPISQEEWTERFLAFQLSKDVPVQIVELFEVARGAMLYGYFFYPLYTLGLEQVYRVADTAVTAKCNIIGVPAKKMKIESLVDAGIFTPNDAAEWNVIRQFRNLASHPE
jgi:hypothetical protein